MASDFDSNKVVSIEFDNKQFEKDVSKTIDTIDALDKATSENNLKGDGLAGLSRAFGNLGKDATDNIDQINSKLSDTSQYSKVSDSVNEVSQQFSTLQIIGIGALLAIGDAALDVGSKIASTLTSGIRDGWSEYNLIMDSTQTILANTERYGTTLDDVTGALDVLNEYADKTIYNFSQMTRNIGLFTTAGMNLEDSVTAIKGMSNLGAVFGADNAAMARATYQMSQAMSSGYVKLRDWMSMENAGMGGKLLQEELIRTAAIMSGQSVDAFKEYIGYSKGFRNTLENNWLTADIFMETMRKYAGESREYWESLKAADGSRLYTDEEIDELMKIAESAEEAATKVRTFRMMVEALMESIGSGWSQTFRLLIGDLNEAKEFWTPINDLLSSIVNGVSDYRNSIIKSWRDVYREIAIEDMMTALRAIGDVLGAIGRGIARAFGNTHTIATHIGQFTEAIGDLATTMALTDDELEMLSYFVEGIISPFTLLGDLVYDLARTFFNASDAMNDFDERGESLADKMQGIRKMFFDVLGAIGAFGKRLTELIRNSGFITTAVNMFANAIKGLYDIVYSFLTWVGPILENIFVNYLVPFVGLFVELGNVSWQWLQDLIDQIKSLDINLLEDMYNAFNALHGVFVALIDPTINVSDAWNHFVEVIKNTSIASVITTIKDSLNGLWQSLQNTHLFQMFINMFEQFKQTEFGSWLVDIVNKLKEVITTVFGNFTAFSSSSNFISILEEIIDRLIGLKNRISEIGLVNTAVEIIRNVFDTVGSFIHSIVTGIWASVGSIQFDSNVETIVTRLIRAIEVLMILGAVVAAANLPRLFARTAHNIIFQIFDPISDMFMVVKERFKRDTWKVLGDFFKSLAIFVGVMAASILVLASLKDPYIALPLLVTMFTGIAVVIGIITASINRMFDSVKRSGLSGIVQSFAIVAALSQISTIMGEIIAFIAIISGLAYLYSKASSEDQSTMAIAFGAMVATFMLIGSLMIILLEKLTSSFNQLAILDKGLGRATRVFISITSALVSIGLTIGIMSALLAHASGKDPTVILSSVLSLILAVSVISMLASYLMTTLSTMTSISIGNFLMFEFILGSMMQTILVIGGCAAILSLVSKSTENMIASVLSLTLAVSVLSILAASILKFTNNININAKNLLKLESFMMVLSLISVILSIALKIMLTEEPMKILEATVALLAVIGGFSVLAYGLTEFSNSLSSVQFKNIAKLAIVMAMMIGSLFPILLAMKMLNDIIQDNGLDTVKSSMEILAEIFIGMFVVMGLIGVMANSGIMNVKSVLGIAASMLILSQALIPIAISITAIASVDTGDTNKAIKAATAIAIVLGSMAIIVGGVSVVWSKLKTSALYIAAMVASMLVIAQSLILIATALAIIGSIKDVTPAVDAITKIMLGIGAFLLVFSLLGALTEGIGAAVILAAAVAFLAMSYGVVQLGKAAMFMGMAMQMAGAGVKSFADAMVLIENINANKLLANFRAIAEFFPTMANMIIANRAIITESIVTLFEAIGTGIASAIKIIFKTVTAMIVQGFAEHFRIVASLTIELFDILMSTIHAFLVILNDFLKKEIGPGGTLRQLAVTLSDFILWLAEFLGGFMITAVTKLIESLAEALEDDGIITRLFNAVKHLVLSVKLALYNWLGVASLGEWAAKMTIAFFGGLINSFMEGASWFADKMNDIIEEATGERITALDDLYNRIEDSRTSTLVAFNSIFDNYQQASIAEVQAELDDLNAQTDALDATLAAEEDRQRRIQAEGDTSVYNPSRYYAAAAGVEDWNNQLDQSTDILTTLSSLFGGSGGISDIIGNVFGGSSGEGGSILSNLFGGDTSIATDGENAGSTWGNGFMSGLGGSSDTLSSLTSMDFSNLDSISNVDFSNFNLGLENANMEMDELSNPVITPVIDDTEYNAGLDRMEGAWNSHRFDELAIDVGNSMTLREVANGDATTDGSVSYNFTQNNYSNRDLTRTEIYRDGQNLLRASGLFRAN